MTDTSSAGVGTSVPRQASRRAAEPTGWVGWIAFAGTMMVMVGILHVIQGLVALFSGKMWARVIGIILASVSLLVNFAFIAAYPFWSVIVIAMDIFVILALTVHGREMKEL